MVTLQGKVGKNVDVNVDYSDVNRAGGVDQSKQDISIKYHGDTDSPVQEVDFGDLQLVLLNTEFAGFSKQLFGLPRLGLNSTNSASPPFSPKPRVSPKRKSSRETPPKSINIFRIFPMFRINIVFFNPQRDYYPFFGCVGGGKR